MIPGLFDAYNHRPSATRDAPEIATAQFTSLEGLLAVLAERAQVAFGGSWRSTERGLSRSQLGLTTLPTAAQLDVAAPDHPVALRFGAHAMVLNSRGHADSGLGTLAEDPPRGRLERDADGRPTGPIHEYGALRAVERLLTQPTEAELGDALAAVQRQYAAVGITSVRVPGVRPGGLARYQALRHRGALCTRTFGVVRIDPNLPEPGKHDLIASWQVRSGFGDEWLRLDALKLFVDGGVDEAPGARDAHFLDVEDLTRVVSAAVARGWAVTCHAVGERAGDVVLDAYERAAPARAARPTLAIEHG